MLFTMDVFPGNKPQKRRGVYGRALRADRPDALPRSAKPVRVCTSSRLSANQGGPGGASPEWPWRAGIVAAVDSRSRQQQGPDRWWILEDIVRNM